MFNKYIKTILVLIIIIYFKASSDEKKIFLEIPEVEALIGNNIFISSIVKADVCKSKSGAITETICGAKIIPSIVKAIEMTIITFKKLLAN